jgi:hypothetical protein
MTATQKKMSRDTKRNRDWHKERRGQRRVREENRLLYIKLDKLREKKNG